MPVFIKQCHFSKINTKINKLEIISFSKSENSIYSILAVAKSAAEPGNSNLTKGEQHAQRAFFVRSTRSPKERLETLRGSECLYELGMSVFGHTPILSMVACNGKGSPFADFLWCQFSSLLHATAQTLESLAVALINQPKDTVMKRFKFLTGSRLIITIYANNRQEAENKIKWANKPICIGLNLPSIQGVQYA
ncbi:hypothetical protein [Mannheimia pernigra]|nr:hypothetical protein [Mannheimia pernigra]